MIEIIKKTIKEQGYTVKDFCKKIGMHEGAMSEFLNGHRQIYSDKLIKIFEGLGIKLDASGGRYVSMKTVYSDGTGYMVGQKGIVYILSCEDHHLLIIEKSGKISTWKIEKK